VLSAVLGISGAAQVTRIFDARSTKAVFCHSSIIGQRRAEQHGECNESQPLYDPTAMLSDIVIAAMTAFDTTVSG
jgi:hypothetical protein